MASISTEKKLVNFAHKYLSLYDSVTAEQLRTYIFDVQGRKGYWCPNDSKIISSLKASKEFGFIRGNGKKKKSKFVLLPN
tara:strand:- start:7471 stop:7710 length:240 start_codon:yes stop_codon:yes gene_type:complete